MDIKTLINYPGPHETLVLGTFYRRAIAKSHHYDVVASVVE